MLVAGVAEDGKGAGGVEEKGKWRKKGERKRANGKVFLGVGLTEGEIGEVEGREKLQLRLDS